MPGMKTPTRQDSTAPRESEKLQKVLAAKGLGSRREIERWITAGRIAVNGQQATLGTRVTNADRIAVDGRPVSSRSVAHRYLLYNKPEGEICTRDDPEQRPTVYDKLPRLKHQRWVSVGRLDFNTSGLLLFTTDGHLANRLMHPATGIEREYAVRVLGEVSENALARMRQGVMLDGEVYRFSDIKRGRVSESPADKASRREGDPRPSANQWYYVVLMAGRNREVRRIWTSQGLTVSRLKRVRYGSFFIPSGVKVGHYTDLKPRDVKELYNMADKTADKTPDNLPGDLS